MIKLEIGKKMYTLVEKLHDEAMEFADRAFLANREAQKFASKACDLESQAANLLQKHKSSEPSRSILYRSAATLAYQAGRLKDARKLVAKGLSGDPPPPIKRELKDLYEQVKE